MKRRDDHNVSWPHDALGVVVPPRLEDLFNSRTLLLGLLNELDTITYRLMSMANFECCSLMDMKTHVAALRAERQRILQQAPFTQCNCKPTDDCQKCEGRKWISGIQYSQESRLEGESKFGV